jgi:uncharacterized protein
MKTVFADTLYWVSGLNPRDQWHRAVVAAETALGNFRIVTTETVLIEVLNYYCENSTHLRQAVARLVNNTLADPDIEVVAHSSAAFQAGLQLYEARPDKGYSLTDCISMNVMRERGILEVLTHDKHFAQEGFVVLI